MGHPWIALHQKRAAPLVEIGRVSSCDMVSMGSVGSDMSTGTASPADALRWASLQHYLSFNQKCYEFPEEAPQSCQPHAPALLVSDKDSCFHSAYTLGMMHAEQQPF